MSDINQFLCIPDKSSTSHSWAKYLLQVARVVNHHHKEFDIHTFLVDVKKTMSSFPPEFDNRAFWLGVCINSDVNFIPILPDKFICDKKFLFDLTLAKPSCARLFSPAYVRDFIIAYPHRHSFFPDLYMTDILKSSLITEILTAHPWLITQFDGRVNTRDNWELCVKLLPHLITHMPTEYMSQRHWIDAVQKSPYLIHEVPSIYMNDTLQKLAQECQDEYNKKIVNFVTIEYDNCTSYDGIVLPKDI